MKKLSIVIVCALASSLWFANDAEAQFDCEFLTPGSAQWHEEGCGDPPEPGTTTSGNTGSGSMNDDGFAALRNFCKDAPVYTHPIQILQSLLQAGIIDEETLNELMDTVNEMALPSDPLVWASIDWSMMAVTDPTNADFWRWFDTCVAVGYIPNDFPGPKTPEDEV